MTDGDFGGVLLAWFAGAMRPLPWRHGYDPYRVWISEIMLQQTQMERGVHYFNKWLGRFPDVHAVARAPEDEILAAWEGLGYYSRARNLHAAARRIVEKHGGVFPSGIGEIRALPGVGPYTAAAIASIAFDLLEPAVDANALRIFCRVLDVDSPATAAKTKAAVADAARSLMAGHSPRLFNQAVMELGALVCGKNPRCPECPVRSFCLASRNGTAKERPIKRARPAVAVWTSAAAVLVADGRVLVRKRPAKGLWAGLWEFPNVAAPGEGEGVLSELLRRLHEDENIAPGKGEPIGVVRHGYTTNRVTVHGFLFRVDPKRKAALSALSAGPDGARVRWARIEELAAYPFAAGHRKLLERLGWK